MAYAILKSTGGDKALYASLTCGLCSAIAVNAMLLMSYLQ
jgi:hypothetical protein